MFEGFLAAGVYQYAFDAIGHCLPARPFNLMSSPARMMPIIRAGRHHHTGRYSMPEFLIEATRHHVEIEFGEFHC